MPVELVPAQPGLELGNGVNILTGEPKAPCLSSINPITWSGDNAAGGLNPADYTWGSSYLVETNEQYSSLLSTAATASGHAWTEDGEVSMSATMDYLKSQSFADTEIGFVIGQSVMTNYTVPTNDELTGLTLTSSAKQLAIENPAQFVATHGTHVVVGFTFGGSFYGSLTIRCRSEHDKMRLKTALAVEINDFEAANGKFTSDFALTQSHMNSWYQATADHKLVGGSQGNHPLNTIDQMQAFADTYFIPGLNDAGVGDKIAAICYPWDLFPNVVSLPGYKPGMLSLNVDETAWTYSQRSLDGLITP